MVRLVLRVSHQDGKLWRIDRARYNVCNAESIRALEGSDGILVVVGDVRVIRGPILEVMALQIVDERPEERVLVR